MTTDVDIDLIHEFEGGPSMYFARGHIDPDEFVVALSSEWDAHYAAAEVHRGYWRMVPYCCDGDSGVTMYKTGPGRGAFKATWIDWRPGDEREFPEEMEANHA